MHATYNEAMKSYHTSLTGMREHVDEIFDDVKTMTSQIQTSMAVFNKEYVKAHPPKFLSLATLGIYGSASNRTLLVEKYIKASRDIEIMATPWEAKYVIPGDYKLSYYNYNDLREKFHGSKIFWLFYKGLPKGWKKNLRSIIIELDNPAISHEHYALLIHAFYSCDKETFDTLKAMPYSYLYEILEPVMDDLNEELLELVEKDTKALSHLKKLKSW
jgi:hypothetical protein